MQCAHSIALEILGLDLADWKVDVLNGSAFVLLLLLHLLFGDFQADDEVGPLRGEDLEDMLEVKILLGDRVTLEADHQLPFLLHLVQQLIEGLDCLADVGVPERTVLAELLDELDGGLERQLLHNLRE